MLLSGQGVYLAYLVVLIVVLAAKMASEEQLLTATLGEQYLRYKARVPRLIPASTTCPGLRCTEHSLHGISGVGEVPPSAMPRYAN